jgi:hypothetical protein
VSLGIVLPLILLALLVFVLVVLARRAGRALAVSRAATAFQQEVLGLSGRLTPVIEELLRRVDAVRHHQLPAEEIRDSLAEAHQTFESEREVIAGWLLPSGFTAIVGDMAEDLDRLTRAVETIDFGTQLVVTGTNRQRELEAQTAIKRGYLNLLHARQSFQDHAATVASRAAARTDQAGSRASSSSP